MIKSVNRTMTDPEIAPDLRGVLGEIAADLAALSATRGPIPSIMVAANECVSATSRVALALGEIAAEQGMRVLLVAGTRSNPVLLAAANPDRDPMLVDICGELRIALSAKVEGLILAPKFRSGRSIAAALIRHAQAELIEEIAAEFNIVVIDGGMAADAVADGLTADVYLRVGQPTSRRDDDRMLTTLGASGRVFVGTVAASALMPTTRGPHMTPPTPSQRVATPPAEIACTQGRRDGSIPWSRPAFPRRTSVR